MRQVYNYRRCRVRLLAVLVIGLFGCSGAGNNLQVYQGVAAASKEARGSIEPPAAPITRGSNEVAPGFLIRISSPSDEKINGEFRINADGVLKLPYGVKIQTGGMNVTQLQQSVAKAFAKYFKTPPRIDLSIIERWYWVDVRGLVEKPGPFLVKPESSLDQIIAEAGGLQKDLNGRPLAEYVRIRQMGTSAVLRLSDYYSGAEVLVPQWIGGDSVFFQSERGDEAEWGAASSFVQIVGEVREPGEYRFRPNADFFDYLVTAGGPTDKADLSRVVLVRSNAGKGRTTFTFELEHAQDIPPVQGGDIILVRSDVRDLMERKLGVWTGVSSVITSLTSVILLGLAL